MTYRTHTTYKFYKKYNTNLLKGTSPLYYRFGLKHLYANSITITTPNRMSNVLPTA